MHTGRVADKENRADLIAFGRPFLANPELVSRMKARAASGVAPIFL